MKRNEPGTQSGRILSVFVILLPLLAAATRLLPDVPAIDLADLLGSAASAGVAHVLATLSLVRTILGARRSAAATEWLLRRVLGGRVADRFRDAPAISDLIVNACHELRARNSRR